MDLQSAHGKTADAACVAREYFNEATHCCCCCGFDVGTQVDQLNARSYSLLPGPELKTVCTDRCEPANAVTCDFMAQQLDKNTNAQHKLDLKPGAQVCSGLVCLLWSQGFCFKL